MFCSYNSLFSFRKKSVLQKALAMLFFFLGSPHKQFLSNYPLFLTNTVPVIYFSFQTNLIFKESPTLWKDINGSFLSSQYFKWNIFLSTNLLPDDPLSFSSPPHFEQKTFFYKEPFSSDKKSSSEATSFLKPYVYMYIYIHMYVAEYLNIWRASLSAPGGSTEFLLTYSYIRLCKCGSVTINIHIYMYWNKLSFITMCCSHISLVRTSTRPTLEVRSTK